MHKKIIKIVLAVAAVWLVSAVISETFSSYVDQADSSGGLIGFEGDYELRDDETTVRIDIKFRHDLANDQEAQQNVENDHILFAEELAQLLDQVGAQAIDVQYEFRDGYNGSFNGVSAVVNSNLVKTILDFESVRVIHHGGDIYLDKPDVIHSVTFDLAGGNIDGETANVSRTVVQSGSTIRLSRMTLPVPEKEEYIFSGWSIFRGGLDVTFTENTIVRNENETVTARWTPVSEATSAYTVTVIDAWLGESGSTSGEFVPSDVVYLHLGDEPTVWLGIRNRIDWEITPSVEFDSDNLSFIMPASDVEVRAVRTPSRALNIEGGEFADPAELIELHDNLGFAELGATVTIRSEAPEEGYRFVRWENVSTNCDWGCIPVEFADETSPTTSFIVPLSLDTGEVEIRAVFEQNPDSTYTVTVIGGFIDLGGGERRIISRNFVAGDVVTINHSSVLGGGGTLLSGESFGIFNNWNSTPAVDLTELSNARSTFIMPASDVEIRAIRDSLFDFSGDNELVDDDTPVKIMVLFTTPSTSEQRRRYGTPEEISQPIIEEEHALFISELEELFSKRGEGRGAAYEIHNMHYSLINGAIITVPSNLVRIILGFENVCSIHRYEPGSLDSIETPSTPNLEITMISNPASGIAEDPTMVLPGSVINYSITVTNIGEEPLRDVVAQNLMSMYLRNAGIRGYFNDDEAVDLAELGISYYHIGESWTGEYESGNRHGVYWIIDVLEPGESFTLVQETAVRETALLGTSIGNEAQLNDRGLGHLRVATYHEVGGEDGEELPTVISRDSDEDQYTEVGDELQFTITVNNLNDFNLYDFTINEELPAHVAFVEGSIQVQRRADQSAASSDGVATYVDIEDVVAAYIGREIQVDFPTLLPGHTYVRFLATVESPLDQPPGGHAPPGVMPRPPGGVTRPPGVVTSPPGVVIQPPGGGTVTLPPGAVIQPPRGGTVTLPPSGGGAIHPLISQPPGGQHRSDQQVSGQQGVEQQLPREQTQQGASESLSPPDVPNPSLPQTGVALVFSVLSAPTLLISGFAIALRKKKAAKKLSKL